MKTTILICADSVPKTCGADLFKAAAGFLNSEGIHGVILRDDQVLTADQQVLTERRREAAFYIELDDQDPLERSLILRDQDYDYALPLSDRTEKTKIVLLALSLLAMRLDQINRLSVQDDFFCYDQSPLFSLSGTDLHNWLFAEEDEEEKKFISSYRERIDAEEKQILAIYREEKQKHFQWLDSIVSPLVKEFPRQHYLSVKLAASVYEDVQKHPEVQKAEEAVLELTPVLFEYGQRKHQKLTDHAMIQRAWNILFHTAFQAVAQKRIEMEKMPGILLEGPFSIIHFCLDLMTQAVDQRWNETEKLKTVFCFFCAARADRGNGFELLVKPVITAVEQVNSHLIDGGIQERALGSCMDFSPLLQIFEERLIETAEDRTTISDQWIRRMVSMDEYFRDSSEQDLYVRQELLILASLTVCDRSQLDRTAGYAGAAGKMLRVLDYFEEQRSAALMENVTITAMALDGMLSIPHEQIRDRLWAIILLLFTELTTDSRVKQKLPYAAVSSLSHLAGTYYGDVLSEPKYWAGQISDLLKPVLEWLEKDAQLHGFIRPEHGIVTYMYWEKVYYYSFNLNEVRSILELFEREETRMPSVFTDSLYAMRKYLLTLMEDNLDEDPESEDNLFRLARTLITIANCHPVGFDENKVIDVASEAAWLTHIEVPSDYSSFVSELPSAVAEVMTDLLEYLHEYSVYLSRQWKTAAKMSDEEKDRLLKMSELDAKMSVYLLNILHIAARNSLESNIGKAAYYLVQAGRLLLEYVSDENQSVRDSQPGALAEVMKFSRYTAALYLYLSLPDPGMYFTVLARDITYDLKRVSFDRSPFVEKAELMSNRIVKAAAETQNKSELLFQMCLMLDLTEILDQDYKGTLFDETKALAEAALYLAIYEKTEQSYRELLKACDDFYDCWKENFRSRDINLEPLLEVLRESISLSAQYRDPEQMKKLFSMMDHVLHTQLSLELKENRTFLKKWEIIKCVLSEDWVQLANASASGMAAMFEAEAPFKAPVSPLYYLSFASGILYKEQLHTKNVEEDEFILSKLLRSDNSIEKLMDGVVDLLILSFRDYFCAGDSWDNLMDHFFDPVNEQKNWDRYGNSYQSLLTEIAFNTANIASVNSLAKLGDKKDKIQKTADLLERLQEMEEQDFSLSIKRMKLLYESLELIQCMGDEKVFKKIESLITLFQSDRDQDAAFNWIHTYLLWLLYACAALHWDGVEEVEKAAERMAEMVKEPECPNEPLIQDILLEVMLHQALYYAQEEEMIHACEKVKESYEQLTKMNEFDDTSYPFTVDGILEKIKTILSLNLEEKPDLQETIDLIEKMQLIMRRTFLTGSKSFVKD